MLKFVKHHMETIAGIEVYPLISLVIFFVFFVGLIYYVVKMSKKHVHAMEIMPLEDDAESMELNNSI